MLTKPGAEGVPSPTLSITAEGAVSGFTGVNRLHGNLLTQGDVLFGPLASTRRAGPPAAMKMESEFLSRVAKSTQYRRTTNELKLLDADNTVLLVFRSSDR